MEDEAGRGGSVNIIHNTGKVPLIVTFGGLTIVIRPGAIWEPTHEYEYLGTLDI